MMVPFPPGEDDPTQHPGSIYSGNQHILVVVAVVMTSVWLHADSRTSPLSSQVMVAAATVASWSPTPAPFRQAWVAKVPERELEKA